MNTGSVIVSWDAAGHLNIKTSFPVNSGDGRKAAVEKLLDAARAINGQGTPLALPPVSGVRLLGTG